MQKTNDSGVERQSTAYIEAVKRNKPNAIISEYTSGRFPYNKRFADTYHPVETY